MPTYNYAHAKQVCTSVDETLQQLRHVLSDQGITFTEDLSPDGLLLPMNNRTNIKVDLSPIARLMQVAGCPAASPTEPQSRQQSKDVATSSPMKTVSRRRRAEPASQAVTCTFQDVLNAQCTGPPSNNGTLIISFEGERNAPAQQQALEALRSISPAVGKLTLRGAISQQALSWVVYQGDWSNVNTLEINGLIANHTDLGMFSSMASLTTLTLSNSNVLSVSPPNQAQALRLLTLDLSNNFLEFLPDAMFADMHALHTLDLSGNRFTRVEPKWFQQLPALTKLFLNTNKIEELGVSTFAQLTSLTVLHLNDNSIRILQGALEGLSSLRELDLSSNGERFFGDWLVLHKGDFGDLSSLQTLSLKHNSLDILPGDLFSNTTMLKSLDLSNNRLSNLHAHTFQGLGKLTQLHLNNNRLRTLESAMFHDSTRLRYLYLQNNFIWQVQDDALEGCESLEELHMESNGLSQLPDQIFHFSTNLTEISLRDNQLTTVNGALHNLTNLKSLWLEANGLTQLCVALPSLERLWLDGNRMQDLVQLDQLPSLQELRMSNHHISNLNLTAVLIAPKLRVAQLDASPDVVSVAHVNPQMLQDQAQSSLHTLTLVNVDAREWLSNVRQAPAMRFRSLHLGHVTMDDHSTPMIGICTLLNDDVQEFRLLGTSFQHVSMCPGKRFSSVLLPRNHRLLSIELPTPLATLDVSDSNRLSRIAAPSVEVLDISGTQVPPTLPICDTLGTRALFARELSHVWRFWDVQDVAVDVARRCAKQLEIFDISQNRWMDTLPVMNHIFGGVYSLSNRKLLTTSYAPIVQRKSVLLLETRANPVQCTLTLDTQEVRSEQDPATLTSELVYSFDCSCARGFSGPNFCFEQSRLKLDQAVGPFAVGITLGILLPILIWWYVRYRRVHRRARLAAARINLQEQLLVERDAEVMALKKAWEIEYDELRMIKRVAAGAFGVVFKAEWDTVMVAVKVLQQAVMMIDKSTVLEFEKEVEFLQRTRHPNVVRFFGAGTDPNGSPFLVLEFVAMGSLKDLLRTNLDKMLREVKNRKVDQESHGEVLTEEVGETVTLVSTAGTGTGAGTSRVATAWDLKLRLLREVASGMAFIHSLDQMHRDLKSGNVLVSSSLRAKITDFGSIRQCFARDRNQHQQHTRLSSSSDADPQYSQQAGLQTMTSMTLTAGVGTPLYMAPEALTGDKYSFEADVFSFGVLMWEVATQRVPDLIEQEKGGGYRGPILATISNLLDEGKRLSFSEDRDKDPIPEWFKTVALKCMEQQPKRRPSFKQLHETDLKN
ncbi:TKL protein kinase [Salpingoeca rosetta]|uniref:TKL protein kinase n=1 Tax=Salpingoeca rosetta (strain ATCC 50818 / BSB-021) TaxID=946362 RepID=F2UMV1_SALR5|nr:TKL protein kinase [Salpingoeca rosetta]EGD78450.1 TKL protein kinase [Salpingoeca rosetta]|eukprot:XP_004989399.1 TKL protein kinase [Salpingoeca rosetta]